MRFSGIFQTISFTVRKRFVNAFLPPPYTVGKPSKNAPKRLKKFAMPAAKTRTLCRRLAAPSHQKTALYGHFSASCRFLHPKLQPVGPFLILCAFSHLPFTARTAFAKQAAAAKRTWAPACCASWALKCAWRRPHGRVRGIFFFPAPGLCATIKEKAGPPAGQWE